MNKSIFSTQYLIDRILAYSDFRWHTVRQWAEILNYPTRFGIIKVRNVLNKLERAGKLNKQWETYIDGNILRYRLQFSLKVKE